MPDDEFIPFEPSIVNKYGPISRAAAVAAAKVMGRQSSAGFGEATISTPAPPLRRPVPAPSPLTPPWPPQYNGELCKIHQKRVICQISGQLCGCQDVEHAPFPPGEVGSDINERRRCSRIGSWSSPVTSGEACRNLGGKSPLSVFQRHCLSLPLMIKWPSPIFLPNPRFNSSLICPIRPA